MRKLKLVSILVLAFVCLNFVYGQNPKQKKDFTINLADNLLKSISRDIMLTDSQKIALQTNAKEYEVKMKDLKGQANAEVKKSKNKDAVLTYRAKLNQILTKEQLDTLQTKRIQRAIDNATKNNQK